MRTGIRWVLLTLLLLSAGAVAQEEQLPGWLREHFAGEVPNYLRVSENGTLRWTGILSDRKLRHSSAVFAVAVSPGGEWTVSGGRDRRLTVWNSSTGRELRSLKGHKGMIRAIAVSPDGTRIVSGDTDCAIRVWDSTSGRLLRTQRSHADDVNDLAFAPGGEWLASAGDDGRVCVFSGEDYRLLRSLLGGRNRVLSVAVSPDASRLFAGDDEGMIRVWDAETGELTRDIEAHGTRDVNAIVVAPNGEWFASAADDGIIKVWNALDGELIRTLGDLDTWATSLALSPDGNRLACDDHDGAIHLWHPLTGKLQRTIEAHHAAVTSLTFLPDGSRVVSGSEDAMVRVWDAATGKQVLGPAESQYEAKVSPDGAWVVTRCSDRTLRVWNAESCGEIRVLRGHESEIGAMAIDLSGRRIFSGDSRGTLRIWDVASGEPILTRPSEILGPIRGLALAPDGAGLLCTSRPGRYHLSFSAWDAETGEELRRTEAPTLVTSAVASPDGTRVAVRAKDGDLIIWAAETGKVLHRIPAPLGRWLRLFFSADGRWVVGQCEDHAIRAWDAATGTPVCALPKIEARILDIAASAEKGWIAVAASNRPLTVWRAPAGKLLHELAGPEAETSELAASTDGTRLVSDGYRRIVRVWNPGTGDESHNLEGHEKDITALTVGPGDRIGSADHEGIVRIWDAGSGQLLHTFDVRKPSPGSKDMDAPFDGPFTSAPIGGSDVSAMAISPDGRRLVRVSRVSAPSVWNLETGWRIRLLHTPSGPSPSVAFSPDGRRVLAPWHGGRGYRATTLLDAKTARRMRRWDGRDPTVSRLEVGRDGSRVVTRRGREVRISDAETGKVIHTFEGHEAEVVGVAVSASQRWVYSAGKDGFLCVWDTRKPEAPLADRIAVDGVPRALVMHGTRIWVTCENGTVCRYRHTRP